MIVFDMLFRAVNIISYRLSIWYSRYSEAIGVNNGSRFLNSFGASDMKVFDLTENEQRIKYIIMTGGYPD